MSIQQYLNEILATYVENNDILDLMGQSGLNLDAFTPVDELIRTLLNVKQLQDKHKSAKNTIKIWLATLNRRPHQISVKQMADTTIITDSLCVEKLAGEREPVTMDFMCQKFFCNYPDAVNWRYRSLLFCEKKNIRLLNKATIIQAEQDVKELAAVPVKRPISAEISHFNVSRIVEPPVWTTTISSTTTTRPANYASISNFTIELDE